MIAAFAFLAGTMLGALGLGFALVIFEAGRRADGDAQ